MSESQSDNGDYAYYRDNQYYIEEIGICADEIIQQAPALIACQHDSHTGRTWLSRWPTDGIMHAELNRLYGSELSMNDYYQERQVIIDNTIAHGRDYMSQAYSDVTRHLSGKTPSEQSAAWTMATAFTRAHWQTGRFYYGDEAIIVTKTAFHGAELYATSERFDITRHCGVPDRQQRFILTWIDDSFIRAETFRQSDGYYPKVGVQPDTTSLSQLTTILKSLSLER